MHLLFLIFIVLVWISIAFFTNAFINAIIFVPVFLGIYFLHTNTFDNFSKINLLPSKIILAFSFWGCVGLCLFAYQKSINCLTCMQGYLGRDLNASFGGNPFMLVVGQYKRFLVMFSLSFLWTLAIIFFIKRNKKC